MERWKEAFHEKVKIYQQDVFSWYAQERLKFLNGMVTKSHNTCASQLLVLQDLDVSLQVAVQIAPSKILKKNLLIYVGWLSTLCLSQC